MVPQEAQTEALIREKAKLLFFQKGLLNATTQEIADEAGVNRALIHYYFRSRELLLETLLEDAVSEKKDRIREVLSTDLPFREKIATFIEIVIEHGMKYPYLENFMVSEAAKNPGKVKFMCQKDRMRSSELIKNQLQEEVDAGRIAPITAEHFMINLVALCSYPVIAKNVIQNIHGMSDTAYRKFLQERKPIILRTLFGDDIPERKS